MLAINQDPVQPGAKGAGSGFKIGKRIFGGDLNLPCKSGAGPTGDCANVWGRPLSNGDFALAFVNNAAANATVTCDAACWASLLEGATPAAKYTVRDLWAKTEATVDTTPEAGFSYSAGVTPTGGSRLFRVSAAKK